ncbi:MAG: 30S ribosomal protein S9 [bacterium]
MSVESYQAVGRRKSSVARVRLVPGEGRRIVNGISPKEYFCRDVLVTMAELALEVTATRDRFDVIVNVSGGGAAGQAGAVRLGVARALVMFDPAHRRTLRLSGLLTRDPRMKERKKYGQPGARKRFQFSKR